MRSERFRLLSLLVSGKITVKEADELLNTIDTNGCQQITNKKNVCFFCVQISNSKKDDIDIKVPLNLVRAGMKLKSLIPAQAVDKLTEFMKLQGINFEITGKRQGNTEELIQSLAEMQVDVKSQNGDTVKVYCQ